MSRFFGVFLMFPVTKGRNKKSILLYESLNICNEDYAIALRLISDDYELSGDQNNAIEYQKKR